MGNERYIRVVMGLILFLGLEELKTENLPYSGPAE